MKKSNFMKLAMIAVAAGSVVAANAQSNGPSGLSARIGAYFPTSDSAKNLGSTWFVFGADYKLNSLAVAAPGVGLQSYLGISADYYAKGGDSNLPVALTYNLRQSQMVYSIGIGPEFRNSGDLTSTGVGLAEQVGVSYELGNMPTPIFIQAKYFISGRPELRGLGVYVGIRF